MNKFITASGIVCMNFSKTAQSPVQSLPLNAFSLDDDDGKGGDGYPAGDDDDDNNPSTIHISKSQSR